MADIEFDRVVVSRGSRRVLRGVSLAVAAGETVALVGRSGSGKTTLLRLVNRLLDPESGRVTVLGRDTTAWDPYALRRQIGYAIQEVGLFPHLTVAGNIAVVPRLLGWGEDRIRARVEELLALVGLDAGEVRDRWPDELSGGQRQRVGLARALAADPRVLLMDEPFGALDPITRADLHAEFRVLQDRLRRAVLLVTHDLSEAFALAGRVAVLHDGEVIACAPPDALAASDDPRVCALVETRFG
ncbi:MAG: ATP-binding cassette domain-containing protein [Acidobacteriota bacterium]